ncbi:MAG: cytochrome c biogenesis protein CcsA [Anaerohalosphaeraceae bacterium]
MLELMPLEKQLFWGIMILSLVSSGFGCVQIVKNDVRYRRLLLAFASLQITLGAVLLIFRAVEIKAFPITGVFESMLVLMVFIGITFLFLSAFMQQVWFLSVMVWVLAGITLLSALVAKPAEVLQEAAKTPWVIVHAFSMSLSGAMVLFAGAMSILFLWSRRCLKKNQFLKLFGKMPSIEKLQALNLLGLRLGFIAMTFGLISGIGLVAVSSLELGMTLADWLTDSKIVLIGLSWILLLWILLLRRLLGLSAKTVAQVTLVVCFLILFAFIGSKIFCKSDHVFSSQPVSYNPQSGLSDADYTHRH